MRVRAVVTALTLAAVAALSGCGGEDDAAPSVTVLTQDQVTEALLSLDNLPEDFKASEDDEDEGEGEGGEDDDSMGCLDKIEAIDDVGGDSEVDAEQEYEADNELAVPAVYSAAGSFASDGDAEQLMSDLRNVLADCTEVDQTDEDGARFRLTISTDDTKIGAQADDQVNVIATGSVAAEGVTIPMAVHMSVIRVDNHMTMSGFVTMAEGPQADADEIAAVALARLVAVIEGEPVPDQSVDLDDIDFSQLFGNGDA